MEEDKIELLFLGKAVILSSTREAARLEGTGFLRFDVNNTGYGWTEFGGNEQMPRQAIQLFDI